MIVISLLIVVVAVVVDAEPRTVGNVTGTIPVDMTQSP